MSCGPLGGRTSRRRTDGRPRGELVVVPRLQSTRAWAWRSPDWREVVAPSLACFTVQRNPVSAHLAASFVRANLASRNDKNNIYTVFHVHKHLCYCSPRAQQPPSMIPTHDRPPAVLPVHDRNVSVTTCVCHPVADWRCGTCAHSDRGR